MEEQSAPTQRPRIVLQSFKPVSIFLCPCRAEPAKIRGLSAQVAASGTRANRAELLDLSFEPFEETCLGLRIRIQPGLFSLPDLKWVVIALFAELSPVEGDYITFEQMLAFNSNFRVCQGELERQDTPKVGPEKLVFHLSSGRSPAQVYEQVARQALGCYQPPEALKRAVTLTIAQFEHVLNDIELYLLGTIAHSDEVADPIWATSLVQERAYDRWRPLGIRFFTHSYSLVCGCAPVENTGTQNLKMTLSIFRNDYVQMGARLALERANLLELRGTLQNVVNLDELHTLRKNWVDCRRILGIRWTAEGTQRAQIEQVWRKVSGLENMSDEIDRRFEQTVDLFEAEATDRLNRLLVRFQIIVTGFAAAAVTAELTRDQGWRNFLPWTFGIGIMAMIICWVLLHYSRGHFRRRKDRLS